MNREMPLPADEERVAAEMARELEAMAMTSGIQPSEGFSDRVMGAIAEQPLPQPVRAFGIALVAGQVRQATSAVGDAWRVAVGGFAPIGVRAQALALVLVVAVGMVGLAGGATVGALGLLDGDALPQPSPSEPAPSVAPSAVPSPSPSVSPSPSPSPRETPEPPKTAEPTETPERTGTDDSGGGSGSGSGSGSGTSGSGSGFDDGTPEPERTPEPGGTDDHGGG